MSEEYDARPEEDASSVKDGVIDAREGICMLSDCL
jgi:hypothetical protein